MEGTARDHVTVTVWLASRVFAVFVVERTVPHFTDPSITMRLA